MQLKARVCCPCCGAEATFVLYKIESDVHFVCNECSNVVMRCSEYSFHDVVEAGTTDE